MRKFLSQFLTTQQLEEVDKAFKQKNPDSSGLPTYIPKARLDEEIGKRKTIEEDLKKADSAKEAAVKEVKDSYEAKLKEIPEDWKDQLDQAKKLTEELKVEYEGKLEAHQKASDRTLKLYEAGAKNIKAVSALLDDTKELDTQLTELKKSDPYLFNTGSAVVKGTGKTDDGEGGSGDELSTSKMFAAVGIPYSETKQ